MGAAEAACRPCSLPPGHPLTFVARVDALGDEQAAGLSLGAVRVLHFGQVRREPEGVVAQPATTLVASAEKQMPAIRPEARGDQDDQEGAEQQQP